MLKIHYIHAKDEFKKTNNNNNKSSRAEGEGGILVPCNALGTKASSAGSPSSVLKQSVAPKIKIHPRPNSVINSSAPPGAWKPADAAPLSWAYSDGHPSSLRRPQPLNQP